MTRTVLCKKLNQPAPGLQNKPFPGELGEKIYQHISKPAWDMWLDHQTTLINEYRLNMLEPKARDFLRQELEKFLFGGGESAKPSGYVAPAAQEHKHEQEGDHKHDHKHDHDHDHAHDHMHDHGDYSHSHDHSHGHDHHHDHGPAHEHHHDHPHDHPHDHKHGHDHPHSHEHPQKHDHGDHKPHHQHEHKHIHKKGR